jgi:integrase
MPKAPPSNLPLIRGQSGQQVTEEGFQTLWQRLMVKASEAGVERFTFHDLKAKGVSDTIGDKQQASGHKTAAMVGVYDRKLNEVKPAGFENE